MRRAALGALAIAQHECQLDSERALVGLIGRGPALLAAATYRVLLREKAAASLRLPCALELYAGLRGALVVAPGGPGERAHGLCAAAAATLRRVLPQLALGGSVRCDSDGLGSHCPRGREGSPAPPPCG